MKRLILVAVLVLLSLSFAMAEEKSLTVSGSVNFSIGDSDIDAAPGPAFGSGKAGAVGSLSLGVANEHAEAGVTISLTPTITKTALTTAGPADNSTNYAKMELMIKWYAAKKGDSDYFPADTPAYNYSWNTSDTSKFDFIGTDGITVKAIDDASIVNLWTSDPNCHIAATALYNDILGKIENEIDEISILYDAGFKSSTSPDNVAGSAYIDQNWSSAEQAEAVIERDTFASFFSHVFGSDTEDSFAATFPVSGAYLKLKSIFDALDIIFEVNGKQVSIGSMVTSNLTAPQAANMGVTLGLAPGVVEGLGASVLFTHLADTAAGGENHETYAWDEPAAAAEGITGLMLDVGYTLPDIGGGKVKFGIPNLSDASAFLLSVLPSISVADAAGLSIGGEFNVIGGATMGMGAGASIGMSIMGISPTIKFYWKDENFHGNNTYDALNDIDNPSPVDAIDETSLTGEFGSTDIESATALNIAVAVNLAELMGMKLISINGGYGMMLSGSSNPGWNAGLTLDLSEVAKMPISLGFSAAQYGDVKLTWGGNIGYTYSELFKLTASINQTQTDAAAADIFAWNVAGSIGF